MSDIKFYKRSPESPEPPFKYASYLEVYEYFFEKTGQTSCLVPDMIDWYYTHGWIIIPLTQTEKDHE